jgi:sugar phosphate isomerase/epimerase
MELLSAKDLILALHRHPENNFSPEQTEASFERSLRDLCKFGVPRGITIHLRLSLHRPPWLDLASATRWLDRVGEGNLRLAVSTAGLLAQGAGAPPDLEKLRDRIGLWLAAAPERDVQGSIWSEQGRLAGRGVEEHMAKLISLVPDVPVALDAVYADWDQEYLDALCLPAPTQPATASAPSHAR